MDCFEKGLKKYHASSLILSHPVSYQSNRSEANFLLLLLTQRLAKSSTTESDFLLVAGLVLDVMHGKRVTPGFSR